MHGGESTTPRRLREGGTLRIKTLINIFFRCLQRWRRCRGGQDGTRGKGTRYSEDHWERGRRDEGRLTPSGLVDSAECRLD